MFLFISIRLSPGQLDILLWLCLMQWARKMQQLCLPIFWIYCKFQCLTTTHPLANDQSWPITYHCLWYCLAVAPHCHTCCLPWPTLLPLMATLQGHFNMVSLLTPANGPPCHSCECQLLCDPCDCDSEYCHTCSLAHGKHVPTLTLASGESEFIMVNELAPSVVPSVVFTDIHHWIHIVLMHIENGDTWLWFYFKFVPLSSQLCSMRPLQLWLCMLSHLLSSWKDLADSTFYLGQSLPTGTWSECPCLNVPLSAALWWSAFRNSKVLTCFLVIWSLMKFKMIFLQTQAMLWGKW